MGGSVAFIACGSTHAIALMNDSRVYTWGGNQYGQLGQGDTTQRNSPTPVMGVSGAVRVAAGAYHSMVLLNTSQVIVVGYNFVAKFSF